MDKPVTKQEMEDRFEKQEVLLQQSLGRQTDKIIKYVDQKFDEKLAEHKGEVTLEIGKKIDQKFEEKFQELKDHSEALIENVRDAVGGAYKDELELVKDRVTRLEL